MMNHMRRSTHRPRVAAATVLISLVLAGCTSTGGDRAAPTSTDIAGPTVGPMDSGWNTVTPAGMVPASLSAGINGVVVGGATDSAAPGPILAQWRPPGWQDIPMEAATEYGAMATVIHLSLGPDRQVTAIGSIAGGAHLNPRWSAWIGSTDVVVEEPQTVETFGGPEAGGLTGLVSGPNPMIVGTWTAGAGLIGVATWGHQDQTWVRRPSPPVLSGNAAELLTATATAATGAGSGVVITGLATTFVGGIVHQQAVLWFSGDDPERWTRVDLDGSDQDSAATDVSCAAGSCVTVGRLGDRLAAWRVDARGAVPVATQASDLPERQIDRYAGQPRVGVDAATTVIAPGTSGELLVGTEPLTWTSVPAPAGEQRRVGVHDGTAFLLLRQDGGQQDIYSRDTR